jgi:hypothetical protein
MIHSVIQPIIHVIEFRQDKLDRDKAMLTGHSVVDQIVVLNTSM